MPTEYEYDEDIRMMDDIDTAQQIRHYEQKLYNEEEADYIDKETIANIKKILTELGVKNPKGVNHHE